VIGVGDEFNAAEQDLRIGPGDQVLFASEACVTAAKRESLPSLFARLGGSAHSASAVAARLIEHLERQSLTEIEEGTLLLLRKG
jgi:hypothetical protein